MSVRIPAAIVVFALASAVARGQVKTDGTLGPAGALSGSHVHIAPTLGRQAGPNLFHSFDQFNISHGQTVTFDGPPAVHNVLARVTGQTPSNINGTLACSIPDASFYLINPAGVVFGPGAALDVKGSFTVTTADQVRLTGHGRFVAAPTVADSVLTTGSPVSFGFLRTGTIAGVSATSANLKVSDGRQLSVVAGGIKLSGASLQSRGGRVDLVAAAPGATVSVTPGLEGTIKTDRATGRGDVAVDSGSTVDVSGPAGGRAIVDAGSLLLDHGGQLLARTQGAGRGHGVSVDARSIAIGAGSTIGASADAGSGRGGDIALTARNITIDPGPSGNGGANVGIFDRSNSTSSGPAGAIDVSARSITLRDGGEIAAGTFGKGAAGDVRVRAGKILLDGGGTGGVTGISTQSNAGATGPAGNLTLRADGLSMASGAIISTRTFGSGRGGDLTIAGGKIVVTGTEGDLRASTKITSSSEQQGGAGGRGGALTINADSLTLNDGGLVLSQTRNAGDAGDLTLDVGALAIRNGSQAFTGTFDRGRGGELTVRATSIIADGMGMITRLTGLSSEADPGSSGDSGGLKVAARSVGLRDGARINSGTFGAGRGGDALIKARSIEIIGAGGITSNTAASGAGGNLTIAARSITMDGTSNDGRFSGIAVDSLSTESGAGDAGHLDITSRTISVVNAAAIRGNTRGPGRGGTLSIHAGSIAIDGRTNADKVTGIATRTETGSTGDAGTLAIIADSLRLFGMGAAQITSDTRGAGRGGNASIRARSLVVEGASSITADSSGTGRGGDLMIAARSITLEGAGSGEEFSGISVNSAATGDAGHMDLRARSILLTNTGAIQGDTQGPGRGGGVAIMAGSLIIRGAGGITADANGGGRGGDLTVIAKSLEIDGTGNGGFFSGISTDSTSTGSGGDTTIRAGSLVLRNAGTISADASASGHGGNLTLSARSIRLDGVGDPETITGISTDSNSTEAGAGDAGQLTIRARHITVMDSATISASTSGPGRGGAAVIRASTILVDGTAHPDLLTDITARAEEGSTGAGGTLSIRAGTLHLTGGGAEVTAATLGTGAGGSIDLRAGTVKLDGGSLITASTAGPGRGGDVVIRARTITATGDATNVSAINAQSLSTGSDAGAAGTVRIDADAISFGSAGLSARTSGPGAGGNIVMRTRSLDLRDGSFISAAATTGSSGRAGDVNVSAAGAMTLRGESNIASRTLGSGDGGTVAVDARRLSILTGSFVTASTFGPGRGGDVALRAHSLRIDGSGNSQSRTGVFAGSNGPAGDPGPAGSITVDIGATATLRHGGFVVTESRNAAAGGIDFSAGHSVLLDDHSALSATALKNGGDIRVTAPLIVSLAHGSSIRTQSSGANGGNVTIDPLIFRLQSKSFVTANGGINGGNVNINAEATPGVRFHNPALAGDNLTAVGRTGVSGTVEAAPATSDVAAALVPLDANLFSANLTLQDVCPIRLDDATASSFLVVGRGATSVEPGGLLPAIDAGALDLRPPPPRESRGGDDR